jgi:hypothetical protein
VLESRAMSRLLRLFVFVAALFACALQPRAQVVNITPHCDEFGVFAWGLFSGDVESPAAIKSHCDGTVPLSTISNAPSGSANQVAAFSVGQGVALKGSVDWSVANPLPTAFPAVQKVEVKVWVLFKKAACDLFCVKLKMANFLVWANDRLSAERAGIQLVAAGGGTVEWVFDKTALAATPPVSDLVDFSESGKTDCVIVEGTSFPASIKTAKVVNVYVIRTEKGTNHRGYYCRDARDSGFANAFVAFEATNSTILHEISHNLGLGHNAGILNVMNDDIQNGAFFTEGQNFRMNFSTKSALAIFGTYTGVTRDCSLRPHKGCPLEASWIWPDP